MSRLTHDIIAACERAAGLAGLDLDQWVDLTLVREGDPDEARAAYATAAALARKRGQDGLADEIERLGDGRRDMAAFWSEAFGGSYAPVKWGKHQGGHRSIVREAMAIARDRAPELGDVIAALSFQIGIAHNREAFLREESRKRIEELEHQVAALSGGPAPEPRKRFGHSADPVRDFVAEVAAIEAEAAFPPGEASARAILGVRIMRAMEFRVGAVPEAIEAKAKLRECERAWAASP